MSQRCAVYCRISRDDAGDGLGVARQEQDARALAERRGWTVVEVFTDNDISASTLGKKRRPEYDRMLAAVRSGAVDAIAAYSNSRLTRRPAEWLDLIRLASEGLLIATVASGEHDLTTADGRAVAMTIATWDAAEAERTGERVKRAAEQRASTGKAHKGRYRLLGYRREDWAVIPEEAAVVREVFARRLSGQSIGTLARWLNDEGVQAPSGGPWRRQTVVSMLSRPAYAALVSHKGEIVAQAQHEPIVDETTWRAAQTKKEAPRPGANARRFLLSGIALCHRCSGSIGGNSHDMAYRCQSCSSSRVPVAWADDPIISVVMDRERRRVPEQPTTDPRQADLDRLDEEIVTLRQAHDVGDIALADLLPLLRGKRSERARLEKSIAAVAAPAVGLLPVLADWDDLDLAQRRTLVLRHLVGVVVGPGQRGKRSMDPTRLTIHWRDGEVETLSHERLAFVARYDSGRRSWTVPPATVLAAPVERVEDLVATLPAPGSAGRIQASVLTT